MNQCKFLVAFFQQPRVAGSIERGIMGTTEQNYRQYWIDCLVAATSLICLSNYAGMYGLSSDITSAVIFKLALRHL
jgi:hypothetical protein